MNISKIPLFAAALLSISTASSLLYGRFFDMDAFDEQLEKQLEHMEQSIQHMRQHYKKMGAHSLVTLPNPHAISLASSDKNVTITIADIELDNVEARLNDTNNQLTITTPTKKFIIATRDTMVAVEAQEMVKQKEKNDTKKGVLHFSGTSVYHAESSVKGKPMLEKQTTDYNPDKKELIITIPFQEVSKGKVIPINTLTSQAKPKEQSEKTSRQEMPTGK